MNTFLYKLKIKQKNILIFYFQILPVFKKYSLFTYSLFKNLENNKIAIFLYIKENKEKYLFNIDR